MFWRELLEVRRPWSLALVWIVPDIVAELGRIVEDCRSPSEERAEDACRHDPS